MEGKIGLFSEKNAAVQTELIRLYFKNGVMGIAFVFVILALVLGVAWGVIPKAPLLFWAALVFVTTLMRLVMARTGLSKAMSPQGILTWARWYTALHAITAGMFGIGALLFFDQPDVDYTIFYTVIILGMMTSAAVAVAPYQPAVYWVAAPSLLLLAGLYVDQGAPGSGALGFGIVVYVLFLIVLARNIRQQLHETLELRLDKETLVGELADTVKAKDQFLARASHDLRQPLHAMSLNIAALSMMVPEGKAAELTKRAGRSIESFSLFVNSMLDLSRLDAGDLKPRVEDLALGDLLAKIQHDFAEVAREKGLELRVVSSSAVVRSDPVMLERILMNLVSNAIRYTVTGKVLVGCRRKASKISIEVWDTGIGLSDEGKAVIFKEFSRLNEAEKMKQEGVGLGLSIVERMAKILNHQVTVESIEAVGSGFMIEMEAVDDIDSASRKQRSLSNGDKPNNLTIAVIDNDPEVLKALVSLLEGWGHRPIAGNGLDDVLAQETKPDLIIADYQLDNFDTGVEAIIGLRRKYGEALPAAIISGYMDSTRIAEAADIGAQILLKPLKPDELREICRRTPVPFKPEKKMRS